MVHMYAKVMFKYQRWRVLIMYSTDDVCSVRCGYVLAVDAIHIRSAWDQSRPHSSLPMFKHNFYENMNRVKRWWRAWGGGYDIPHLFGKINHNMSDDIMTYFSVHDEPGHGWWYVPIQ